jgi:hypothetical protein
MQALNMFILLGIIEVCGIHILGHSLEETEVLDVEGESCLLLS